MNIHEHTLLDLLKKGRDTYGFTGVRAEFEAEGARPDEVCRLLEIGCRANLDFTVKIGGCEAIRDLNDAKKFGAKRIIAPMIESPYALLKYKKAIHRVYSADEQENIDFLFNIETEQAFTQLTPLLKETSAPLRGIVFGRVDFVRSQQLSRDYVNSHPLLSKVQEVAAACQKQNLNFLVGGGISPASLSFLAAVQCTHLSGFETRKISFEPDILQTPLAEKGLCLANEFELLWLKNKQNYYRGLCEEDHQRILLLEKRMG